MAPAVQYPTELAGIGGDVMPAREATRMNRAAWRQGHFAAKSAPQHRDFAAGEVGTI